MTRKPIVRLTPEQKAEIIKKGLGHQHCNRSLARVYNVSESTISQLLRSHRMMAEYVLRYQHNLE